MDLGFARWWVALALLAGGARGAQAARPAASAAEAEGLELFERHVRPALVERCFKCHSGQEGMKVKGGLDLGGRDALRKGGVSGPAIVPGDPEASLLIRAIRHTDKDLAMPPKEPLPKATVAAFERWVKLGAPDPRQGGAAGGSAAAAGAAAAGEPYDYAKAREHWAYGPVRDPAVPAVDDPELAFNDVDRFILEAQRKRGLRPARLADKRALLRRATFDLTGLPPTPEELDAFLADGSPDAFAKVVDHLLASPRYGERWGRHWLDVVRYADTSGCNSDYPVPDLWKYRNYVIDAFNRDVPYDRFVREQVAGDLMPAADEARRVEQLVATGYLANSRRFGSRNAEFHLTIEDTIDNLGKAVLGLSISCARCHDSKFDPIPQADYYALYGIFASTRYAFPGTEIYKVPRDLIILAPAEEVARVRAREEELTKLPDTIERLQGVRNGIVARLRTIAEKGEAKAGEKAELEQKLLQAKADIEEAQARQRKLDHEREEERFEKVYGVSDKEKPADAKVHLKGDPGKPGPVVRRGFLTILGGQKLPEGAVGSGRLELAGWLTDPSNPLTARVMVNRIWQHHFGKGLVQTPNDFGSRGKPPTHPDLLDYLASRFVEGGWSVKRMHRLIMLSRAYRQASDDDASNAAIDPANDHLWRFDPRRLTAEEIRDAMMFVSDALDLEPPRGPHPFPPETQWKYTQHKPFVAAYPSAKRSVYLMQQRIRKHPLLEVFDGADTNATTAQRPESTTPLQALFAMNSPLVHEWADRFAVRVGMAEAEEHARVRYAYRLALAREPSEEELSDASAYLAECRRLLSEAGVPADKRARRALASYLRMVLASNEFFFLD